MLQEFLTWGKAQAKFSKATLRYTPGRWRHLERAGVDWPAFMADPLAAKRMGDTALYRIGMDSDSRHASRTLEKMLNRAARFGASRRPDLVWPHWKLTKEPKSEGKVVSDGQVSAMLAYQHRVPHVQARRRALAWLAFWTRLRRSEIARLRWPRDFNAETRRVWVEYPAKGGKKRWKAIPGNAWHPNGAVQAWLRVRPTSEVTGEALWTNRHGARVYAMTVDAVGMEFQRMGRDLGFPVSFVRTRRAGSQFLQRHKVRTRIIKADLSHSSELVTETYLAPDGIDAQEAEFEACKVPGFVNRSRGGSGSRRRPPGDFDAGAETGSTATG